MKLYEQIRAILQTLTRDPDAYNQNHFNTFRSKCVAQAVTRQQRLMNTPSEISHHVTKDWCSRRTYLGKLELAPATEACDPDSIRDAKAATADDRTLLPATPAMMALRYSSETGAQAWLAAPSWVSRFNVGFERDRAFRNRERLSILTSLNRTLIYITSST